MGDDQNEIKNAIQNGLFNEGIYRIKQDSNNLPEQIVVSAKADNDVIERISPPQKLVHVVSEPEIKPIFIKKDDPPIKLPEQATAIKPIAIEEKEPLSKQDTTPEFFGKNQKGVALLVNYADERWIYFKDKMILEKILASIHLTFDDVALINTHYFKPESVDQLAQQFNISKIIGFAVKDSFLKDLKREVPIKTTKAAVFLMDSDLAEIAMNTDKKRVLWNNIKIMFNIG